jgi:hypothetical protein
MTDATDDQVFVDWLEAMHPRLSRFEDFLLPANVIHEDGTEEPFLRDYSRKSLEQLEQFILDRWPTQAAFLEESDTDFIDGATRYIGETLLRAYGGGWHLNDVPTFDSSGRPFVLLDTLDKTPITPFFLLTALLKRRTGRELTRVYDGQALNIAERREQEGPDWQPRRDPVPGITS